MIVREREDAFVMIKQADHSVIAGDCFANWKPELLKGDAFSDAVRYGITNHDFGWKELDDMPLWDDALGSPYDFKNFPVIPKLVFYKNGINELENLNPYAGKLCSRHYMHLTAGDMDFDEAKLFIKNEEDRQDRLEKEIEGFDRSLFEFHYSCLTICDNLSLYICLNEPGTSKEKEHPLFKDGIPIPEQVHDVFSDTRFDIRWADKHHIQVSPFPFKSETTVRLKQRIVPKATIKDKGLVESFRNTPEESFEITFVQG